MKASIEKVTKFAAHSGAIRYNRSSIDGKFITEGSGFHRDGRNELKYGGEIIDTWYTIKIKGHSGSIPFIQTIKEVKDTLRSLGIECE